MPSEEAIDAELINHLGRLVKLEKSVLEIDGDATSRRNLKNKLDRVVVLLAETAPKVDLLEAGEKLLKERVEKRLNKLENRSDDCVVQINQVEKGHISVALRVEKLENDSKQALEERKRLFEHIDGQVKKVRQTRDHDRAKFEKLDADFRHQRSESSQSLLGLHTLFNNLRNQLKGEPEEQVEEMANRFEVNSTKDLEVSDLGENLIDFVHAYLASSNLHCCCALCNRAYYLVKKLKERGLWKQEHEHSECPNHSDFLRKG